jgi:hypothetical protein
MQALVKTGFGAVKNDDGEQKPEKRLQLHGFTQGDAARVATL